MAKVKATAVHNRHAAASLYSHSPAIPKLSPSSLSGVAAGNNAQSHRSCPFSSITLSLDKTHGIAAGKDLIHVLRLGDGNRRDTEGGSDIRNPIQLNEIRSVRISQHFQTPLQPSVGATPEYPHALDALRRARTLPTPPAGGGGGLNINVMDVAWSLPQPYGTDDGVGSPESAGPREEATKAPGGATHRSDSLNHSFNQSVDDLFAPSTTCDAESFHQNQHYPPFIKRSFSAVTSALDDTSVVAAAGSNGVVVAWNARDLVGDCSTPPPSSGNSGGGRGPGSRLFHVGQPEASFLAHSRATNRLGQSLLIV